MWRVRGRGEACTGFRWGNLREIDNWGDLDLDGRIILRPVFRKWDVGVWSRLSWPRIETGETCECGNEPSGSIKCGEFLTSCKPVSFSRRTVLYGVSKKVSIHCQLN
jgi:hypothetical protein